MTAKRAADIPIVVAGSGDWGLGAKPIEMRHCLHEPQIMPLGILLRNGATEHGYLLRSIGIHVHQRIIPDLIHLLPPLSR